MAKSTRKAAEKEELSTIFGGPALTMQERDALKKKEKEEKKAQLLEQRRKAKEAAKQAINPKDRKQATVLIAVLLAFVLIGAAMLVLGNGNIGREAKLGVTYFIDEAAIPEKADDGLTAVITQAYYTKNGGMHVDLSFANGMTMAQHPTRIHLKLMNGDGAVITEAVATNIPKGYYVIFDGYNSYELFIPKKYVKIPNDSLEKISYEITIDSIDEE